jgi:predicted N-acetyltransferase YhbS
MNTTIRAVRTADFPAVYDLLEQSFPEAPRSLFVALTERDVTFRLRHGRVAIVDGRIAGHARIFARTMLVRGVPVAAGGIGSVATRPDTRGGGIATALMRDALSQMRREGMAFSFLFTGIAGFYERLGYRLVREPSFEADARDAAAAPHTGLYDMRPMTERDVPRLLAIYRRAIAGGTGAITRTRRTWSDAAHWLAEDAGGCLVAERNGVPVAYVRSRCRTYGHQILEAECAPRHDGAVAALLAAAGQRAAAHRERLVTLAPGDRPLATAIRALTSATETTEVCFPMMARIVSLEALLGELLPYVRTRAAGHPGPPVRLGLTSHDGERAVLDVTARSVAMRRNGATHVLDAGATLDALLGQQRASTLVRRHPPADVARRIDALLPETTPRFWNSDRI